MIDVEIDRSAGGGRKFSLAFKIEFLREWDNAVERGGKSRLLREYKLSPSTVMKWRQSRDRGEFEASMVKAAGKSRNVVNNKDRAELARLRQENQQLRKKVEQSEAVQEILGKAYELLDGITKSSPPELPQIPISLMSAQEYADWLERGRLN
jgi:transposase-like protein